MVWQCECVNLTDGARLALRIVPGECISSRFSLAFIAYLRRHADSFPIISGAKMLPGSGGSNDFFLGAIMGLSRFPLGFNAPPAMIFMGRYGQFWLGRRASGQRLLAIKHESVLAIPLAALFVLEAVSVIVQ